MRNYIDSHIHLQLINNTDKEIMLAKKHGITSFICNGTSPDDWNDVINITKHFNQVHGCIGIHPSKSKNLPNDWKILLRKLLIQNPNLMIGECGLDKNYSNLNEQETIFKYHLNLGKELNKTVHIHCYGMWNKLIDIMEDEKNNLPPKILLHSHHGDKDLIPKLVKYNAYFSYSSVFLPKDRTKVRDCIKETPIDRILVESDAPDLAKSSIILPSLIKEIASIRKNETEKKIAEIIFENSQRFIRE